MRMKTGDYVFLDALDDLTKNKDVLAVNEPNWVLRKVQKTVVIHHKS